MQHVPRLDVESQRAAMAQSLDPRAVGAEAFAKARCRLRPSRSNTAKAVGGNWSCLLSGILCPAPWHRLAKRRTESPEATSSQAPALHAQHGGGGGREIQ